MLEGNNSRLAAPRRDGKTSLLRRVARDLPKGWTGVYVDFFGVLTVDDVAERIERAYATQLTGRLASWFTGIRRQLRPTLRAGGGPVPAGFEMDLQPPVSSLLDRLALPRRLHERHGRRVLVFDEFQDVLTAQANIDATIRSEIQHHGAAASYIFAGSHVGMMRALFEDRRRAPCCGGHRLQPPRRRRSRLGDPDGRGTELAPRLVGLRRPRRLGHLGSLSATTLAAGAPCIPSSTCTYTTPNEPPADGIDGGVDRAGLEYNHCFAVLGWIHAGSHYLVVRTPWGQGGTTHPNRLQNTTFHGLRSTPTACSPSPSARFASTSPASTSPTREPLGMPPRSVSRWPHPPPPSSS